jgi:lipopolysaccharide export system permease protein
VTVALDTPKLSVPRLRIALLDRYVLSLISRPAVVCLVVTLIAMLLERVLRLITEMAAAGAHLSYLPQIVVTLIPYYLGQALPASFFVALFMVISGLDDGNEIDPMLASGRSLSRITLPLVMLGCVLGVVSLLLAGYLEPFGRFGYHSARNAAVNAGWTAQLQGQVFVSAGNTTVGADRVSGAGRDLHGVFIRRTTPSGETIVTARKGILSVTEDGKSTLLELDKGAQYADAAGGTGRVLRFQNIAVSEPMALAAGMRPRGGEVRELTLTELIEELRDPGAVIPHRELAVELYARIARALSLPLFPLLALPLGMTAKRGRRGAGLLVAAISLVAFQHILEMVRGMAARGALDPLLGVGGVFAIFAALVLWLFFSSLKRPGDTPVSRFLIWVQGIVDKRPRLTKARIERNRNLDLPHYIARLLAVRTLIAFCALVSILQMVDLLDRIPEILDHGVGLLGIAKYTALRLPAIAQQSAGVAVLIGGVFAFSQLARNSEVVVMRAAGVSIFQVFKMALPVALLVAAFAVIIIDQVAPRAQQALSSWWIATAPATDKVRSTPRWFRVEGDVVLARGVSADNNELDHVSIYNLDREGNLTQRIDAARATARDGGWRLSDATITTMGTDTSTTVRTPQSFWKTTLDPDGVGRIYSGGYLVSSATAVRSLGGDVAVNQSPGFYATRLHRTFAEPLAAIIMLLLALPVALANPRTGTGKYILVAIAGGLVYLVTDGLLTASGQAEYLPSWLAAWAAPVIFAAGAGLGLLYAEK